MEEAEYDISSGDKQNCFDDDWSAILTPWNSFRQNYFFSAGAWSCVLAQCSFSSNSLRCSSRTELVSQERIETGRNCEIHPLTKAEFVELVSVWCCWWILMLLWVFGCVRGVMCARRVPGALLKICPRDHRPEKEIAAGCIHVEPNQFHWVIL